MSVKVATTNRVMPGSGNFCKLTEVTEACQHHVISYFSPSSAQNILQALQYTLSALLPCKFSPEWLEAISILCLLDSARLQSMWYSLMQDKPRIIHEDIIESTVQHANDAHMMPWHRNFICITGPLWQYSAGDWWPWKRTVGKIASKIRYPHWSIEYECSKCKILVHISFPCNR